MINEPPPASGTEARQGEDGSAGFVHQGPVGAAETPIHPDPDPRSDPETAAGAMRERSPLTSADGAFTCTPESAVEAAYLLSTAEGVLMNAADPIWARANVGDAIRDYVLGDITIDEAMAALREEASENSRAALAAQPGEQP